MKKLLLTFILVIGIIFGFMMVTSYAYYAFENGSTVFDTTTYNEDINISYETSEYISVSNAIPIEDKYASSKASSNRFSITVNNVDNDDIIAEVLLSISLVNINIDDALKNEYFKYQLIHNSEVIKEGTGLDFTSDRFEMVSKEVIYSDLPNNFIFRVWISENGLDQNSMKESTFTGSIEVNAVKTRNIENTRSIMMERDTSVAFWQDTYKINLTSIDFKSNIDVPSTAIVVDGENNYWDISASNSKGKVIAYIEDDGISDDSIETGYKLTIGGEGLVYASSGYFLFDSMTNVTNINFNDSFSTTLVTNMREMFAIMSSLASLDVSTFDTSNVTTMQSMFADMDNLPELDVSNFDTSNVTNMYAMFYEMFSLTSLDLSNFDTSNVTDMGLMFRGNSSLISLDLSNFDTSSVTNMYAMFARMSSLTNLNLSSFDTSKVTGMNYMFNKVTSLTSLDLSNFDTSSVTSMISMFQGMNSLTSLNLSSFDTSKVTDMRNMFNEVSSLTSLDLSSFDTSSVISMRCMVRNMSSLTSLGISNFDTSNVTDMSYMFSGMSSLTSLDLSSFDTSNVTDMTQMFDWVPKLILDCSDWNVDKVTAYTDFNTNSPGVTAPTWVN